MDYIWARSSVYLVVEPNALEDLTCGVVDVSQGSLSINLQCLCPSHPDDDVTAILSRLTAYVSQHIARICEDTRDILAQIQQSLSVLTGIPIDLIWLSDGF